LVSAREEGFNKSESETDFQRFTQQRPRIYIIFSNYTNKEFHEIYPSTSTDSIYCPLTDEVIFVPNYDRFNDNAEAFVAFWPEETIDKPMIKDPKLQATWEAIYQELYAQENSERNIWELLKKFLWD